MFLIFLVDFFHEFMFLICWSKNQCVWPRNAFLPSFVDIQLLSECFFYGLFHITFVFSCPTPRCLSFPLYHPFKLISCLTLKSGHKYFLLNNKSNHGKHQMVNTGKCYRMIVLIALSLLNLLCSTSSKNINIG